MYNLNKPVTVDNVEFLAMNQAVITLTNGKVIFNSYGTNIVEIDKAAGITKVDEYYYNYSATTSKYRCKFLGELKKETDRKIKEGKYILADLNESTF